MDRNKVGIAPVNSIIGSLSARRAWIEIASGTLSDTSDVVALRKESVDRNNPLETLVILPKGRSPQGERG